MALPLPPPAPCPCHDWRLALVRRYSDDHTWPIHAATIAHELIAMGYGEHRIEAIVDYACRRNTVEGSLHLFSYDRARIEALLPDLSVGYWRGWDDERWELGGDVLTGQPIDAMEVG